jgi:hypothetical protein
MPNTYAISSSTFIGEINSALSSCDSGIGIIKKYKNKADEIRAQLQFMASQELFSAANGGPSAAYSSVSSSDSSEAVAQQGLMPRQLFPEAQQQSPGAQQQSPVVARQGLMPQQLFPEAQQQSPGAQQLFSEARQLFPAQTRTPLRLVSNNVVPEKIEKPPYKKRIYKGKVVPIGENNYTSNTSNTSNTSYTKVGNKRKYSITGGRKKKGGIFKVDSDNDQMQVNNILKQPATLPLKKMGGYTLIQDIRHDWHGSRKNDVKNSDQLLKLLPSDEAEKVIKDMILAEGVSLPKGTNGKRNEDKMLEAVMKYTEKKYNAEFYTITESKDSGSAASSGGGGVRGGAHFMLERGGALVDAAIVGNDKIFHFLTENQTNLPIYRYADSTVDHKMMNFINNIIKSDDKNKYIACYSLIDIWDASNINPECSANCQSIDLERQINIFTKAFKVALNTFEEGKNIDIELKVSQHFITYLNNKISQDKQLKKDDYTDLIFTAGEADIYFQLTIKKDNTTVCGPINIDKHFSLKEVMRLLTGDLSDSQNGGSKKKIVGGDDTDSEEDEGDEDKGNEEAKKKKLKRKLSILKQIRELLEKAASNGLNDTQQNIIATLFKQMGDLGKIYAALFSFPGQCTSVLQTKDVLCFVQYIIKSLELKEKEMGADFPFDELESVRNQICLLGTEKKTILFKCTETTGNLKDILEAYVSTNYGDNYNVDIKQVDGNTHIIVDNNSNSNGKEKLLLIDNSGIDWIRNIGTLGLDKGTYLKKLYDIRTVIDTFIATCSGTTSNNSLSNVCLSRLEKRLEDLKNEIEIRENKDAAKIMAEARNGNTNDRDTFKKLFDNFTERDKELLYDLNDIGISLKKLLSSLIKLLEMIHITDYSMFQELNLGKSIIDKLDRLTALYGLTTKLIEQMYDQGQEEQKRLQESINGLKSGRSNKYTKQLSNYESLSKYFAEKLNELTEFARMHRHNLKIFAAADAMQIEYSDYSDYGKSELEDLVLSIKKWLMRQRVEMKFLKDDLSSVRSGSSNISNFSVASTSYFLNRGIELFNDLKTPKKISQILNDLVPGPTAATALGTDPAAGSVSPAAGSVSPVATNPATDAVVLDSSAADLDNANFANFITDDVSRLASATPSSSSSSSVMYNSQQSMPDRQDSPFASVEIDFEVHGVDVEESLQKLEDNITKLVNAHETPLFENNSDEARILDAHVTPLFENDSDEARILDANINKYTLVGEIVTGAVAATGASFKGKSPGAVSDHNPLATIEEETNGNSVDGGGKFKKAKKQNKEKNIAKSKSTNVKILRLNKPTSKTTTKTPSKTTTKTPSKTTTKTPSKTTTKKPTKDTKKPSKTTSKPSSKNTTKKPTKTLNKKTNKFKIIKFKH